MQGFIPFGWQNVGLQIFNVAADYSDGILGFGSVGCSVTMLISVVSYFSLNAGLMALVGLLPELASRALFLGQLGLLAASLFAEFVLVGFDLRGSVEGHLCEFCVLCVLGW